MKKGIHPTYYPDAKIKCACGAVFVVGSTEKNIDIEICSNCHPFFTGKEKLVDTAGRVDKFMARKKAAESYNKKNSNKKQKKDQKTPEQKKKDLKDLDLNKDK